MPSPRSPVGTTAANCSLSTCSPSPIAHVQSAGDRRDDPADRERRMSHDTCCQFARGRQQPIMRHHPIDQPDLQRPLRRERIARQEQFERALAPGEPRQPLRSAEGRRHAEIDFRLGETRALAGDGQMHGLGDLASAAERQAVDGCDHRFPECFEPRGHGLSAPDEVADGRIAAATDAACEFVDIGARGERAFARAGQDYRARIGVRFRWRPAPPSGGRSARSSAH